MTTNKAQFAKLKCLLKNFNRFPILLTFIKTRTPDKFTELRHTHTLAELLSLVVYLRRTFNIKMTKPSLCLYYQHSHKSIIRLPTLPAMPRPTPNDHQRCCVNKYITDYLLTGDH